jgi:hypothetical protein
MAQPVSSEFPVIKSFTVGTFYGKRSLVRGPSRHPMGELDALIMGVVEREV